MENLHYLPCFLFILEIAGEIAGLSDYSSATGFEPMVAV